MRSHRSYRGEMDQIRKEAKLRRKRSKRGNRWGRDEMKRHEKRWTALNLTLRKIGSFADKADTADRHKMRSQRRRKRLCSSLGQVDLVRRMQIPNLHWCHKVSTWSLAFTCRVWNQTDFGHVSVCFYLSPIVISEGIIRNLGRVLSLRNAKCSQGTVAEFCQS